MTDIPELIAALERCCKAIDGELGADESNWVRPADAARLSELAEMLKGAQEAWQHKHRPDIITTANRSVLHEWRPVLVLPLGGK